MEIFKMMQNIRGVNAEEEIKNAIYTVKNELFGLTENQTCVIYSSHVFDELKQRHLNVRLINTLDLGLNFEHYFVLVSSEGKYFIVDLTYSQFSNSNFNEILVNGYMMVDNNKLNKYLSLIERKQVTGFTCDDLFYMDINNINR